MKRTLTLIALIAICSGTLVSCKNTRTTEPTLEEIQKEKQALADSVLAQIDFFAEEYISASSNTFTFRGLELTENEKSVKPDYLLDPSTANRLVTKAQKINALAYYIVDLGVRMLYDMPTEEAKGAIAKLAMDVNYPVDIDNLQASDGLSNSIKIHYDKCKESGNLSLFWQFQEAFITEVGYIIAQNPELFYSKITEGQWKASIKRIDENTNAMYKLAKYDDEMATVLQIRDKTRVYSSDEERAKELATFESAKQSCIANQDKFIARRNALLQ